MSWVFGFYSSNNNHNIKKLKSALPQEPLVYFESHNYYIAAGGYFKTCLSGVSPDNRTSWLVCGTGINDRNGVPVLMSKENWNNILTNEDPNLVDLDGHFIALKWSVDRFQIFTDQIGLRDIYIHTNDEGIYFSTKPTWLAKIVKCEIDYLRFGQRWLLPNQVSKKSIFKNLTRLVAGQRVTYSNNKIKTDELSWKFDVTVNEPEKEFFQRLTDLMLTGMRSGEKTSLSLSGGLDSRTLLSILLSHKNVSFDTHTFGDHDSPDSLIAKQICNNNKIPHEQLNDPIPDVETSIRLVKDYTAQTLMTGFASSVLHLRHYKNLGKYNNFIVDGGFGEIWRRELFNKILYKAKHHLINKNINELLPHLTVNRAMLFKPELIEQMQNENCSALERLFNNMPDTVKFGVENWLDLFSIKYTLPTFNCLEQSRMDEFVQGIMPLAQPSVLKLLFAVPVSKRKNGRLIRNLLKKNSKDLTKYPLIKNNITYPFFMSSLSSRIYTRVKSKLGVTYQNKHRILFLKNLKEFSLDRLNSQAVKEFEFYDYEKIKNNVAAFYNGDDRMTNEVDWWLAFEILREQIY